MVLTYQKCMYVLIYHKTTMNECSDPQSEPVWYLDPVSHTPWRQSLRPPTPGPLDGPGTQHTGRYQTVPVAMQDRTLSEPSNQRLEHLPGHRRLATTRRQKEKLSMSTQHTYPSHCITLHTAFQCFGFFFNLKRCLHTAQDPLPLRVVWCMCSPTPFPFYI